MKSNVMDIEVIISHMTDRAVLVKEYEQDSGTWLPLSQVEVDGDVGEYGVVTIPEWLALDKGLI